jgi:hypothetical protein
MKDKKCIVSGIKSDNEIEYVGLGGNVFNTIMIFISVFGIFINLFFSGSYFRKIYKNKNKGLSDVSTVEKTLCLVAVVETFISICWLLNNSFIQTNQKLNTENYCKFCIFIAHFEIFLYLFDWMILSASLYQIRMIIFNPKKIFEKTTFRNCLIFCLLISLLSFLFSILSNMGGVSPMLTCFINVHELDTMQKVFFCLFFTLPFICYGFGIYQVIHIVRSNQYKNEKNLFKEYSYFIFTYIGFSALLVISYICFYINDQIIGGTVYNGFITTVTLLSCSSPLIVGIIRIYRTELVKRLFCGKKNKKMKDEEKKLLGEEDNEGGRINALEKKLLEKLILKYFIAISYALGKSKYNDEDEEEQKNSSMETFMENEHADYKITKAEILKDLDLNINEDIKVLEEPNIDIEITEYNSSVFKKLRQLEGLDEDKILSMFQPKKGTIQLIKKIRDTIYINSTNKLLMLKPIKYDILKSFQKNILSDLYDYLVNHPKSILCRIFGLFKINIDKTEDVYIALMYNTSESLETVDNLSLLAPKNEVKQMKIHEAQLKKNIIIDSKRDKLDVRNLTIDVGKNNFEENINLGGSASDSKRKIFTLNLTEFENDKLIKIINQDVEFLRGKSLYGFSFLVFERNVESKERTSLFKDDEDKSESRTQLSSSSKDSSHIKKYVFNSNKSDIIYTICIIDYYKNKK